MSRLLLLSLLAASFVLCGFAQGNAKDVYQRDTGPGFFKKLPPVNPKDVPMRELAGIVRDADDNPVKGAIVTLTNVKTKAARSFVTKDDGRYSFDRLVKADDYEVHALLKGRKTETKSLSTYDPREKPVLNLRFEEPPKTETAESKDSAAKKTAPAKP